MEDQKVRLTKGILVVNTSRGNIYEPVVVAVKPTNDKHKVKCRLYKLPAGGSISDIEEKIIKSDSVKRIYLNKEDTHSKKSGYSGQSTSLSGHSDVSSTASGDSGDSFDSEDSLDDNSDDMEQYLDSRLRRIRSDESKLFLNDVDYRSKRRVPHHLDDDPVPVLRPIMSSHAIKPKTRHRHHNISGKEGQIVIDNDSNGSDDSGTTLTLFETNDVNTIERLDVLEAVRKHEDTDYQINLRTYVPLESRVSSKDVIILKPQNASKTQQINDEPEPRNEEKEEEEAVEIEDKLPSRDQSEAEGDEFYSVTDVDVKSISDIVIPTEETEMPELSELSPETSDDILLNELSEILKPTAEDENRVRKLSSAISEAEIQPSRGRISKVDFKDLPVFIKSGNGQDDKKEEDGEDRQSSIPKVGFSERDIVHSSSTDLIRPVSKSGSIQSTDISLASVEDDSESQLKRSRSRKSSIKLVSPPPEILDKSSTTIRSNEEDKVFNSSLIPIKTPSPPAKTSQSSDKNLIKPAPQTEYQSPSSELSASSSPLESFKSLPTGEEDQDAFVRNLSSRLNDIDKDDRDQTDADQGEARNEPESPETSRPEPGEGDLLLIQGDNYLVHPESEETSTAVESVGQQSPEVLESSGDVQKIREDNELIHSGSEPQPAVDDDKKCICVHSFEAPDPAIETN